VKNTLKSNRNHTFKQIRGVIIVVFLSDFLLENILKKYFS
jgi:hypothetical protein